MQEPQTSNAKYALSQQTYNNCTTQLLNSHYTVYTTVPKVVQAYLCQSIFGQFLYVTTHKKIQVLSHTVTVLLLLMPCGHQDIFYQKCWGCLRDPTSQPFTANADFPWYEADHSPPSDAEAMNDWSYTFTPPECLHGVYRDWISFSSCGFNVWINLLCYTLSITSLNLFKLYLCLSSAQAPFQQQSNPAEGYLSCPSQYYIQFSPLDTCHSSLMMKKEDASATLAPMWQRKWGFTHTGPHTHTHTHTHSRQHIGRHNT